MNLPDLTMKKTRKRRSVRWQVHGVYETEKDVKQMLANSWKHLKFQCNKQYFRCMFATSCKTRKSFDKYFKAQNCQGCLLYYCII
jgi:hypothetical protein